MCRKEAEMIFRDRADAGDRLAEHLLNYRDQPDLLILALPRGGVPVGFRVAQRLHAPLDVFLVRKLGVPGHEELAMGAVATGGVRVLNHEVVKALHISAEEVEAVTQAELAELARRQEAYRNGRPEPIIRGRTVILVDDGLATGATMRAAVLALRQQAPRRLVVGVPTAAQETCNAFRREVDEMVCAVTPKPFLAVGSSYLEFSQVTDEEVRALLAQAHTQ
jgi:predicted phosphoribosyltransferase